MKIEQIWEHMKRRNKDGVEGASLLYEIFYNRKKLVSRETYNSVHSALNTPICTGVIYGMQARQIAESIQKEREESEARIAKRNAMTQEEKDKEWREEFEKECEIKRINDPDYNSWHDEFRPY